MATYPISRQLGTRYERNRFYSSVRTVLLVRFDAGNVDTIAQDKIHREDVPTRPDQAASELARRTRQIETGPEALGTSSGSFRAALTAANVNLASALKQDPVDGLSRYISLQPTKSVRIINSFRKADELSLTIPWKDAPFDSRLIRAILVLHYEGTVSPETFAEGASQPKSSSDGLKWTVAPTGENLKWVGLIDEVSDSHSDGGDVLNLHGRDLTCLFLDETVPADTEVVIPSGATIVDVVAGILSKRDAFSIVRGPFLRALPDFKPESIVPSKYFRTLVSAKERNKVAKKGGDPGMTWKIPKDSASWWDLISDVCLAHGFQPVIERDQLIIFQPRTLYRESGDVYTQPAAHFFHRDGRTVRQMVYGRNVSSVSFTRKLGRIKAPAVKAISKKPDASDPSKRIIEATFPVDDEKKKTKKTATKVSASGKDATQEVYTYRVPWPIKDKARLLVIAQQIYEGMGRQEMGLTLTTGDPTSFSDDPNFDPNTDPDLLNIQAGDPIEFLVAPAGQAGGVFFAMSELSKLVGRLRGVPSNGSSGGANLEGAGTAFASARGSLILAGFSTSQANQLVKILTSANLPTTFRVNQATVTFDGSFSITIELRDYIRVRADPDNPSQDGAIPRFGLPAGSDPSPEFDPSLPVGDLG